MACAGASTAALLGALGLLGWAMSWPMLAKLQAASIPMAPTTALGLLLLGGALIRQARQPSPRLTRAISLLVFSLTGLQLTMLAAGLDPVLDVLFVRDPELFGHVPTGRMSPLTGLGLGLASLSLMLGGIRVRAALATSLALLVGLLAGVVTLGYVFGAPLLYGGTVVPMAFSTALALGGLGLALVALAPRDVAPLRPFTGPSARARLLRAFLPVAPAIVVAELLLAQIPGLNPGLQAALAALLSAFVVAVVVSYSAHSVGRELEHAQAERERSRRDADRLAAIVESSADAIYAKSLDGTIVAWNASAMRMFGYTSDEALGRSAKILIPPGAEDELLGILEKIGSGEHVEQEATRVRKDRSQVLVSLSESPLCDAQGQVVGVSVIARDVSAQRRAETALRQSEEEFRLLAEAMPHMVWVTRPDGWNIWINQQWMAYTGLTLEESLGHGWSKPFHPDDQKRARDAWHQATATSSPYSLECRLRRADGAYRWWLIRAMPFRSATGEVLKWFGTCTDIDDMKLAEIGLSRSEERFAKVFQSGLVGIGISEVSSGRMIDVNESNAEFFGYTRDEMIGRTVFELGLWVDPADRARIIAGLAAGGSVSHVEAAFRRKSGEIRHGLVSMQSMTLAGIPEPLNIVALVDLTERRQLEAQLLHAQKMEAVGRLAGGVAHDFNNALGVILGYTELLMRQVGEGEKGKLEQILKATQRASGLTRQLLAFSRREVVDPKVLDLNDLLSNLERMLRRLIGEDINLVMALGPDLGQVKADPGQLEQVVMNLCVNARDAMPGGGVLHIETGNADLDVEDPARHEPMAPGRYVRLTIRDEGCGIAKEMLSQIFEPFFTTKEEGKGTGLGLAMVYGIVKQAGGYVFVESEVGRGTTLEIDLPRIDETVGPTVPEAPLPARGSETILLVEDEAAMRIIAREILQEHGYRVLEASGPDAAMEAVRRHPEPIHLLLTDVVMPQMNGRELAEALVAFCPELKVLYMSGYTDDVLAHSGVLESGTLFLEKPFTALALLGRVRVALQAHPHA